MAETQRVKKSVRNTWVGFVSMALSLFVQFISRTVFIYVLGKDYNGINGLFSNVLQVLNLAELGFDFAVAYAMYTPLQKKDELASAKIMNFLHSVHLTIALIVFLLGAACVPLLQHLIADDISTLPFDIDRIRIYFAIYLANTVVSYLWSYKRVIITADQDAYVISAVDNFGNVALYVIQIAVLLITKNYYVYLSLMAVKTLVGNLIISFIADKRYPFLKKYHKERIDKTERSVIWKNVSATFFHKVGTVIIFNTATIVVSAFVGIEEAGFYSNYLLIVNAVATFVNIIFNSVTASVGNLCIKEDVEYQHRVFGRINFLALVIAVFCMVSYVCLFNNFITLWVGGDQTFNMAVVSFIALNSVLSIMRAPVNTFKNAKGLFTKDWYKPLVEAAVGIGLAIGLSYPLGVTGVVIGYAVSSLFVALPIEDAVLFKYGFGGNKKWLANKILMTVSVLLFGAGLSALTYFLTALLGDSVIFFILKCFICLAVSVSTIVLCTFKTEWFKYYKDFVKRTLNNLFRRKGKRAGSDGLKEALSETGEINGAQDIAVGASDNAADTEVTEKTNDR